MNGRARHRFYLQLQAATLLVIVCFALPGRWRGLGFIGYFGLTLLLMQALGRPQQGRRPQPADHLYRLLGLLSLLAQLGWLLTPPGMRVVGAPVLVSFTLFIGWSLQRLVHGLSQERLVNERVLAGALAGYLLLGLSGGLLLSVLETMVPGSFRALAQEPGGGGSILLANAPINRLNLAVWEINFMRLNYFAFVSLTTVGYGDIIPVQPWAQMASIGLSISGPLYIAVVMGVLISRLTVASQRAEGSRSAGPGEDPVEE